VAELSMQAGDPRGARFVFAGDHPRRAIIGVQIDPASGRDGARIAQVSPGGPAAAAGLKAGDVLLSVDGTDLRGRDDPARALVDRMREVAPDQKLRLQVLRDGKPRDVELNARPSPVPFAIAPFDVLRPSPGRLVGAGDGAGERPSMAGMELATVTPALGEYFGTAQGVLVLRAPRQEAWKLRDGDVILAIDGRQPSSGAHASRILRSYQAGEELKLRIMRERKTLDVAVVVPPADRQPGRRVHVIRMGDDLPPPPDDVEALRLPMPQ
jgi:S1-C subfamily serine protease